MSQSIEMSQSTAQDINLCGKAAGDKNSKENDGLEIALSGPCEEKMEDKEEKEGQEEEEEQEEEQEQEAQEEDEPSHYSYSSDQSYGDFDWVDYIEEKHPDWFIENGRRVCANGVPMHRCKQCKSWGCDLYTCRYCERVCVKSEIGLCKSCHNERDVEQSRGETLKELRAHMHTRLLQVTDQRKRKGVCANDNVFTQEQILQEIDDYIAEKDKEFTAAWSLK